MSISVLATGCTTNKSVIKPTENEIIVSHNDEKDNIVNEESLDKENDKKMEEFYNNEPIKVEAKTLSDINTEILVNGKKVQDYKSENIMSQKYTDLDGVVTFRGSNLRNCPSYGFSSIKDNLLKPIWNYTTSSSSWGGGAGWTGQPAIIKWPKDLIEIMNINYEFKQKENFTEVIYPSLDGNIYFLDLDTGKKSREPIKVGNPFKGSVSVDPRGIPLLYAGDGVPEKGNIGYNIFSLIDGSRLYHIDGIDSNAYRGWGAFDSSSLLIKEQDTLIEPGENGILYIIKLNTEFDKVSKQVSINPNITKYRYKVSENEYQGIENSAAIYKNLLYFSDNGGSIQCVDLQTLKPVWLYNSKNDIDDTDASIVVEVENGTPFIYSGNEVDKQGVKGFSYLKKINGLTGEKVWEKQYECLTVFDDSPVNGGLLATPVVGKNDIANEVIFSLARYRTMNAGLMVALDKSTGEELWKKELPNYVWSSPVDFYNESGTSYIVQCDSIGNMYLIQGKDGKELNKINLGANIESTPSIFNDNIVVATRGGKIHGIKIQ
jgi:outer membrane protein assembly factor BamB